MPTTTSFVVTFALAASLVPRIAAGETVQQLVEQGRALYERADLAGALAKLERAYARSKRPDIAFSIARIHFDRGDCVKAMQHYTWFLDSKPGPRSTQIATEKIAECQRILASTEPPEPAPPPAAPEPAPEPEPPVEREPRTIHHAWYTDVLGDVLVVGGLVAGGAGGWFYAGARADANRAGDGAPAGVSLEQYRALHARARQRQTYAAIGAGTGAALVVTGLLRYALADRSETLEVEPLAGEDDGIGVRIGGRF